MLTPQQQDIIWNLLVLFKRFLDLKNANYEVSNFTAFKFNLLTGRKPNEFDRLRITQLMLDWINHFRGLYLYSFSESFVFNEDSVNFNTNLLSDHEIIFTTEMIYLENLEQALRHTKAAKMSEIFKQIDSMNEGTKRMRLNSEYEYEN